MGVESEIWKEHKISQEVLENRATSFSMMFNFLRDYRNGPNLVQNDLKESAQRCYTQICKLMNEASQLYYDGKPSGISDEDFDQAIALLRELEESGKVAVNPDSPTRKVNGGSMKDKIQHVIPMLSLVDVFNGEGVKSWMDLNPNETFVVEPKIDGLSIELWYRDGKLWQAVTRGNGQTGEDVTPAALNIKSIPNRIDLSSELVVRGEVYMTRENFERLKKEEDLNAKNERNSAVGLLKRKDDGVGAGKYLDCLVFNVQSHYNSIPHITHTGSLRWLDELGFSTVSRYANICKRVSRALDLIEKIRGLRSNYPFRTDGAVVKIDTLARRTQLGDNGVYPRWAIAYKYPAEKTTTTIKDIIFQLGKTGRLTPVAILEPVDLDGSTISRCTLHNKNRMLELDACVGDRVELFKAGDIIPAIKTAEHTDESKPFFFPSICPVCGQPLVGDACVNESCMAKIESKLYLWVDKGGLDIRGVSSSMVAQLIERQMIKTPADYYKLTPADLYKLPRMGGAKVKNTLTAIHASEKKSFPEVLVALGIDGFGWKAASKLHAYVKGWDRLLSLTEDECVRFVSTSVGRSLYKALQSDYYRNLIQELKPIFKFSED